MSAVKNPCKGTCSHLCLLRPGGYTCACPEGTNFFPGSQTECDAGKKKLCLLISVWSCKNYINFRGLRVRRHLVSCIEIVLPRSRCKKLMTVVHLNYFRVWPTTHHAPSMSVSKWRYLLLRWQQGSVHVRHFFSLYNQGSKWTERHHDYTRLFWWLEEMLNLKQTKYWHREGQKAVFS